MRPRRRAAPRPRLPEEPLDLFGESAPVERPTPATVPDMEEMIPGASAASAIPVSILTQTARDVMEGAFVPLWVRGEVCDFKAHRNGHWYFCLRDDAAQVRCVVWSRDRWRIPAAPDEGMEVVALGRLTVYPARGDMQFVIAAMESGGDGLWRKALDRTVRALDADGLLAPERKRPIPRCPRRIAVITSVDGAALHDIIAVARRRSPAVEIVVIGARVQGEDAPQSLCAALRRVARWNDADTLIIGRGGGGREDLWAFNDERVARALAAAPMPTIAAIGHEVDMTVCDLVADLRAPTPSAAAEAAVPVRSDLVAELRAARTALADAAVLRLERSGDRIRAAARALAGRASEQCDRRRTRAAHAAGRLHALSPLGTIARGFAVARGADGRALTRATQFAAGDAFDLLLRDGIVRATADAVDTSSAPIDREQRGS